MNNWLQIVIQSKRELRDLESNLHNQKQEIEDLTQQVKYCQFRYNQEHPQHSISNQEYTINNQEYSINNKENSINNKEYSINNREYSKNNKEYRYNQDPLNRTNEVKQNIMTKIENNI